MTEKQKGEIPNRSFGKVREGGCGRYFLSLLTKKVKREKGNDKMLPVTALRSGLSKHGSRIGSLYEGAKSRGRVIQRSWLGSKER